jgi:hypothetical protein
MSAAFCAWVLTTRLQAAVIAKVSGFPMQQLIQIHTNPDLYLSLTLHLKPNPKYSATMKNKDRRCSYLGMVSAVGVVDIAIGGVARAAW